LGERIPGASVVLLRDSYHMICVDHERERVMQNVLEFLGKDPEIVRTRRRATESRRCRAQAAPQGADRLLAGAR
jgi:carboxylesterase